MIRIPQNPGSRRQLTLIGQKGEVVGHYLPFGTECPHYLFRGDTFYVRLSNDAMLECGESDQPIAMLLASATAT